MVIEPADIEWRDGLPYSRRFDDIYFSLENGLAETRYVFLDGNRLAQRFSQLKAGSHFTIAETGFGTGLNILAGWQLWQQHRPAGAWLHFISVEKHPLRHQDLAQALALWPELAPLSAQLLEQYPPLVSGWHRLVFADAGVTLTLLLGDANELLPDMVAKVDAWFLDGFAPDRNPELWQLDLLTHIARLSQHGATLATFTSAGAVRRALLEAGFAVSKQKGYGRKREMIVAEYQPATPIPATSTPTVQVNKHVAIIGAGIAGVSCAWAFAQRGWQVSLFDKARYAGSGASGNPAAIIYPKISPPALSTWHFQQQSYLWLLSQVKAWPDVWHPTGLLWLLTGNQAREANKAEGHPWREVLFQQVNAQTASELAGTRIDSDCFYFDHAGYLSPEALYQRWLDHPLIRCYWQTTIADLRFIENEWQLLNTDQQIITTAPTVIVANALAASQLTPCQELPLRPVRGQISRFDNTPTLNNLKKVLCYGGYITPRFNDHEHCLGASFYPNNTDDSIQQADHQHNFDLLAEFVPTLADALPPINTWQGRASVRTQTHDYLPLVGAVPRPLAEQQTDQLQCYHGLYASLGHGSKGFCYAPLAAEILAAQLNGEPSPVAARVLASLEPLRVTRQQLKQQKRRSA